jgi:foldase protein PrsA
LPQVCYNSCSLLKIGERTKIVTHKRLSVLLLLVMALVACKSDAAATEPPPTATDVPALLVTPDLQTESVVEPGGIEVALTLVTIPDQETIARVNGEEVSTAVYQEELERALNSVTVQYAVDWNDPQNRSLLPSFQEQVLDQIIDTTLLHQLASQEGITAAPEDVDAEIADIQAQIQADATFADWESFLAQNDLTEELVRSLVADEILADGLAEKHGGSSVTEQVHASHILVETEEIGQEVLDKLEAGEDFGALAAEYSTDPGSKDQGGDLGWFPRGMMVPEFEEAAFSLEPGETSGLVQSDFGYHIIRVHEKEEREMDPTLYEQVKQQTFQAWFATQRATAEIERLFDFEASE